MSDKLLQAVDGFVAAGDESTQPRVIKGGQVVDADDPVVEGREHLFKEASSDVEQATAAPGERRNVEIPVEDSDGEVNCPVDGCDYSGTQRGLKIHTARSHDDEGDG